MAVPFKKLSSLFEVKDRWTCDDADVGPFKTHDWPNKQQRNAMYSQKLEWEKERREERRDRGAETDDWTSVTIPHPTGNKDYLDAYGVDAREHRESLRTGC